MHFYCPYAPNNENVALFLRGSQNKVHHKNLSEYGVIYKLQNPERRWHKEALSRQSFTGSLLLNTRAAAEPRTAYIMVVWRQMPISSFGHLYVGQQQE